MVMMGAAFGGGVLLAAMLGGGKRKRYYPSTDLTANTRSGMERQKNKALEAWDSIKGALIGVAATRVKEYVEEIVPGFSDQFQRTQSEKSLSRV
jgi:hypothetical protein